MNTEVLRCLLFTDVVDSTALVQRLGDAAAAALWADHDHRARELLARHAGLEIDRSDGFFLVFDRMADAAAFARAYHREIAAVGVSARVGLHHADVAFRHNSAADIARGAKPIEVEGLAQPLAARVMSLARGGQTLLTAAAREALQPLPEGCELHSHGHYRAKGIAEPIELFELGESGSAFIPPPDGEKVYRVVRAGELWKPVRDVRHNLAPERDAFIGRGAELRQLAQRLEAGARLVTVLGVGGTGKTRLVRRYGAAWLGDWPGGVYFCDLSEARSLQGICFAVASALDVPLGKDDPVVQLGHAIAGRGRCLLILDNFEQVVVHAPASVGLWLDRAAEANLIVTSRERLHLSGEQVLPVEPLALGSEAIELFDARARAQRPEFALDGQRQAVADVVKLLDGLPLAIELAAARVRVLSPAQILERLKDRFVLLAGARGAAARQATLKAAIDWSWELLTPYEQAALAQCSVFEGGFALEAAEAVLDVSPWPEAPPVIDVVQSLVDKSLVRTWLPKSGARLDIAEPYFGMYLSIHEYAAARLSSATPPATSLAQQRHARCFARHGSDDAIDALSGSDGTRRRLALALEADNLAVACRRALSWPDAASALSCLRALWEVLSFRGPFALGVALGRAVLALPMLSPQQRALALHTTAAAWLRSGDAEAARSAWEEVVALFASLGRRREQGDALSALANLHREQGRIAQALALAGEAFELHRANGHALGQATAQAMLGVTYAEQDRLDQAVLHYEAALETQRRLGNQRLQGVLMGNLGSAYKKQNRTTAALQMLREAAAMHREQGNLNELCLVLGNEASMYNESGDLERALRVHTEALAIAREVGNRRYEGMVLNNLAYVHRRRGDLAAAGEHIQAAAGLHAELGNRRSEAIALGNLGCLMQDLGRIEPARRHLERAVAIGREIGNRRVEAQNLRALAHVVFDLGDRVGAFSRFDDAQTIFRELGDEVELALLGCARALLLGIDGRQGEALAPLAEAERTAETLGHGPQTVLGEWIGKARAAIGAPALPKQQGR